MVFYDVLMDDKYALEGAPSTEPLTYAPLQWTRREILDKHRQERAESFPDNSFFDDMHYSMFTEWNSQRLVAREVYTATRTQPPKGAVDVLLDDKVIYTIQVGDGSSISTLRGLWAYDQHWVLETAYVTVTLNEAKGESRASATGQIVEDGELLNERYSYQEMFGFQLMRGRPFYFFKKDGKIGISYDDQVTLLGYGSIPHHGCCSAGMLNPLPAQNMVAFFAQKDGVWYYVEIGVFE